MAKTQMVSTTVDVVLQDPPAREGCPSSISHMYMALTCGSQQLCGMHPALPQPTGSPTLPHSALLNGPCLPLRAAVPETVQGISLHLT